MSWNYRVFRTQYQVKYTREKVPHLEEVYTFREIYYDAGGQITLMSCDEAGIAPAGESLEELRQDLQKIQEALAKPVLTPLDVPGYIYTDDEVPYTKKEDLDGDPTN